MAKFSIYSFIDTIGKVTVNGLFGNIVMLSIVVFPDFDIVKGDHSSLCFDIHGITKRPCSDTDAAQIIRLPGDGYRQPACQASPSPFQIH